MNTVGRMRSTRGYTLVELVAVMAIIAILASIVTATWGTLQARIRYSHVRADMDAIGIAGYTDYSNNEVWAPLCIGRPPFADYLLPKWPEAPCPGWDYVWENWTNDGGVSIADVIRVTLRNGAGDPIWAYCVDNIGGRGDCMMGDPGSGVVPKNLSAASQRYIYCTE